MKIALHWQAETFAERWEPAILDRGIECVRVSAYDPDLLVRLRSFDLFLWNWTLHDPRALLHARSLLAAVEEQGLGVFPDRHTSWHYDDKVAQKFLLESVGAPIVPTRVLFDAESAHAWAATASYPMVFKLRRGAGSNNVRLLRSRVEADRIVTQMFGAGMVAVPGYLTDAATKLRRIHGLGDVSARLRRLPQSIAHIAHERRLVAREKDYVLFQEYLPDNGFDTRIVVIGKKAFGMRRMNRPGDFRASGSGFIDYTAEAISPEALKIAFDVSRRLRFQSMAYDFLVDTEGRSRICEISYCFTPGQVYERCEGHWDESLTFHPGHVFLEDVILDLMIGLSQRKGTGVA
jgi:glutathione synthase/RimK-type ligase-like ATP-grasp enzyme